MSHYNVNAGVPKTLIQHLIRWVVDSGQFDDDANEVLARDPRPGDHPRADPDRRRARSRRRPRTPSGPTRCRTSRSSTCCAAATGPSKIAFLAWHAWHDADAGEWPPGYPPEPPPAYDLADDPALARGVLQRFFASQFKRSALPNGPKVSAGGTMSPRGDWRMPSRRGATAWLAELERPTCRLPDARQRSRGVGLVLPSGGATGRAQLGSRGSHDSATSMSAAIVLDAWSSPPWRPPPGRRRRVLAAEPRHAGDAADPAPSRTSPAVDRCSVAPAARW